MRQQAQTGYREEVLYGEEAGFESRECTVGN